MLHTLTKTTVAVATGDAWLRSMEWCRSMPLENIKPLFPIWGRLIEFSLSAFSGFVVLLSICTPFSFMSSYNIVPPQIWSSYLSVSTHFHLPCSHYYILFCLSLSTISFYFMSHFCYAVHYFFMYRTIVFYTTFQMDNNWT